MSELINMAFHRHDTSARQLGFLARREGFRIVATTINQIRNGSYKSTPSAETIRAIAWLAGVSDEVAFTAAGQPVPGPPLADELPPGTDNLSPKSRKAVIEMLRVLIDLEASNHDDQEQPEANPSGERAGSAARRSGGVVSGQKTGLSFAPIVQSQIDEHDNEVPPADLLAAHPPMELDRDRFEREHGQAGEESQARPEDD
ncbi:hypothetical protein [Arthrobacter sp.]|uniref:hypothetical protein n=1 Tax=Arthrobacter sp. TaxID=1667 RepID=UPI003A8F8F3E